MIYFTYSKYIIDNTGDMIFFMIMFSLFDVLVVALFSRYLYIELNEI